MTSPSPAQRSVRTRIAPSPTGDPHVGTAYIALFNYVFARRSGGQFVLRIEDTDRARSRAGSEAAILAALRWLGLEWDEGPDVGGPHGPYRQSERSAIYREHAEILIARERAYRCFCTPERLAEMRENAKKERRSVTGYDRHCRSLSAADSAARAAAGEPHTVRLAMPTEGVTRFTDRLRGEIEIENAQSDDQVILKSDGYPTYHLANVVDDHLMEISHVVRAEEWISSTPKHVVLYDAFGWEQPTWVHMSLLRNPDKSKISKRKNPVSIDYYRDAGFLADALRNFLAVMGFSYGGDREVFSLAEMVDVFSWDKVSVGGPVFDQEKLRWMNEQYLKELSYEELADQLYAWRFGRDYLLKVLPLMRERIKTLDELIPKAEFFFSGDLDYQPIVDKLKIKDVANKDLRKGLLALLEKYEALESFAAPDLESVTRAFCDESGHKSRHFFMVLRYIVTGRKASPGLFETMEVLGKELTRRRMRQAAELIGKQKK